MLEFWNFFLLPEKFCIVATAHLLKFTCSLVKGGDELMSGDEDILMMM